MVTGGARGIGRAIADHLSDIGYRVAIIDRLEVQAQAAATEIGGGAQAYGLDIRDGEAVARAISDILETMGTPWLLVNNAGWDQPKPFLETTPGDWNEIIAVNLLGPLNLHHLLLPHMAAAGGGRVVNIASESARVGQANVAVYSACKGGVIALTRSLAREFADRKVLLNVISPGLTMTPMIEDVMGAGPEATAWAEGIAATIPLGRPGQPEDYPAAVAFLAGDGAGFITGQTLSISGGRTMT